MALTVAVLGYASADRPLSTTALPAPDRTTVVRRRTEAGWPQLGGCAPRIARHLGLHGVRAACATWVADDEVGRELRRELEAAGVERSAVVVAGTRTAESVLVHSDDGRSICLYDPGDAVADRLSSAQRGAIARAETVCLAVGPAGATREALAVCGSETRVVWAVKADPDAFPPDLVDALLERSDVISHAAAETSFLTGVRRRAPRSDAFVIRTRGVAGVDWRRGRESGQRAVTRVDVPEATGAGDAFLAGVLAGLTNDPDDVERAITAGVETSTALLRERSGGPTT